MKRATKNSGFAGSIVISLVNSFPVFRRIVVTSSLVPMSARRLFVCYWADLSQNFRVTCMFLLAKIIFYPVFPYRGEDVWIWCNDLREYKVSSGRKLRSLNVRQSPSPPSLCKFLSLADNRFFLQIMKVSENFLPVSLLLVVTIRNCDVTRLCEYWLIQNQCLMTGKSFYWREK